MNIAQLKLELGNYAELRSLHRRGHLYLSDEEDRVERAVRESREQRRDELRATRDRIEGKKEEMDLFQQVTEELDQMIIEDLQREQRLEEVLSQIK